MSTGPGDDDAGDIDPADLDDLGDLGGDEDDADEDDPKDKPYVAPTADEYAKLQRKIARQEDRITRLTGKPRGKPPAKPAAADVDKKLLAQLGKPEADDSDDGEAEKWKGIAIQNAASAQIAAAGFSGTAKQAARLAKLIDIEGIEPDRNGSFDLEDEIDELKEEYPQLFAPAVGNGRRAPRVRTTASGNTPEPDPNQSTSRAMMKAAGYR